MTGKGKNSIGSEVSRENKCCQQLPPYRMPTVMCKLLTSVLEEKVCAHLSEKNVLPDEQKGCRKDSRGRKNQLLIDKQILKHCKKYSIISDWEGLIRKRPVIRCCMVG